MINSIKKCIFFAFFDTTDFWCQFEVVILHRKLKIIVPARDKKSQNRRIMDSIIGLLLGLLEAGLALWFLIELISNTCF